MKGTTDMNKQVNKQTDCRSSRKNRRPQLERKILTDILMGDSTKKSI